MANDFRIVISGVYLNKQAYQDITKQLKVMGSAVKIPINIDTTKLDKALKNINTIYDSQGKIVKQTEQYNAGLGITATTITKINKETNLLETENIKLKVNQEQINKEKQKELDLITKIKANVKSLQGQYWQGQFKDSVQNMTTTPSGVKQLNDYYRQLEKTLGTVEQTQKKVNQTQSQYWASARKEALQNMTTKSQELKAMAVYYRGLEKEASGVNKVTLELKKLKENALTTNTILKNFGTENLHKKADSVTSSLQKLNITENMTQKEMEETIIKARQLSNTLANLSREAKSTGNNSMTMGKMIGTAFEKFSV